MSDFKRYAIFTFGFPVCIALWILVTLDVRINPRMDKILAERPIHVVAGAMVMALPIFTVLATVFWTYALGLPLILWLRSI